MENNERPSHSQIEPKQIDKATIDEHCMQEELNQSEQNNICELGHKASANLVTQWVFCNKLNEYGDVLRNKVKLVAKGYNQREWIYFDEIYVM